MGNFNEEHVSQTAHAVVELGDLAMRFSRIPRTGPQHPDGTPETDGDHTVMLTWIAPALANLINIQHRKPRYDVGLVAQYAAIHDAVEVYAGDTPTVKITERELADKEERERWAAFRLNVQFIAKLPWFARMITAYERQWESEARFVRSVDKLMPKIVHVICQGQDLVRSGYTRDDFEKVVTRQRQQIVDWCNEEFLLAVYDATVSLVHQEWASVDGGN